MEAFSFLAKIEVLDEKKFFHLLLHQAPLSIYELKTSLFFRLGFSERENILVYIV